MSMCEASGCLGTGFLVGEPCDDSRCLGVWMATSAEFQIADHTTSETGRDGTPSHSGHGSGGPVLCGAGGASTAAVPQDLRRGEKDGEVKAEGEIVCCRGSGVSTGQEQQSVVVGEARRDRDTRRQTPDERRLNGTDTDTAGTGTGSGSTIAGPVRRLDEAGGIRTCSTTSTSFFGPGGWTPQVLVGTEHAPCVTDGQGLVCTWSLVPVRVTTVEGRVSPRGDKMAGDDP
ncbi:hypothetical protein CMUS01_12822 [Colletotrichum musicola]|uniref:Uncharacterized protein n=1 Tax=Colletotrichum musicola TaxID=2175873 RepID=A0A8H6MZ35_9PEZI|nr:hypothetical protein CMUS01_12822 [Colletotrichum musicola]